MSLILSLMDTIVSLVVKVLWKLISLICFRVYLEVNVHKNPTCFSRWSVRINIVDKDLFIMYSLDNVANLSFEDVKRILWSVIGKDNINVTFDKSKNILIVKSNKNIKNVLTFIKWYDSIELTEEHK